MKLHQILVILPSPKGQYIFTNRGKRLEYTAEYFDTLFALLSEAITSFDSGIQCGRSYSSVTKITSEVITDIASADLAIAVVTARSANVFWQLGIRNALRKGTLILQDRKDQSPLGLAGGHSTFEYSIEDSTGISDLKRHIVNRLQVYTQTPPEPSIVHEILGSDWSWFSEFGSNRSDLFISYASQYANEAQTIAEKARQRGLSVFLDRHSIEFGDEFGEEIRQNLLRSREICILVTPEALNSEWVVTEWGAAWVLNKRITPVLLRCSVDQLPTRLRAYQYVDFHNLDIYIEQLQARKQRSIQRKH